MRHDNNLLNVSMSVCACVCVCTRVHRVGGWKWEQILDPKHALYAALSLHVTHPGESQKDFKQRSNMVTFPLRKFQFGMEEVKEGNQGGGEFTETGSRVYLGRKEEST